MSPRVWTCLAVCLAAVAVPRLAWAEDEAGGEILERAIEAKRNIKTLDDLNDAIDLCQQALDAGLSDQDGALAHELLASTLQQRAGEYARRLVLLLQGAGANPKLAEQYPVYLNAARDDLNRAIDNDAEQIESYVLLGQVQSLPGGDKAAGIEVLDKAAVLTAKNPELQARVILVRVGLREKIEERLDDLNLVVGLDSTNVAARRGRAVILYEQKKLDDSLADLDVAVEQEPDHGPTHELRGIVLAEQKRFDEALESLDRAVDLPPPSAGAYAQRGRVHLAKDDAKEAIHDFDKALLLAPNNPEILLMRAGARQLAGETKKALADVDAVLKLRPDSPQAHRAKALLLAGSGNFREAIPDLKAALQENPKDATMHLQLGVMYSGMKDSERAIDAFTQALEVDPTNVAAFQLRGDTYINMGQHTEALADYDKALELQPDNSGVLNNAAWLLATSPDDELRDGKRAIALAEEACRITEYKAPHILSTLAAGYAESGDFETAIQWSEKAVELGQDEKIKEHLAKELASYKEGKPWRERNTGEEKSDDEGDDADHEELSEEPDATSSRR